MPPTRPSEDTLQGSRDRLASRWYALRGVFDGPNVQPEVAPAAPPARAPAVAVFSLAGGVGKTSLVATLGRALSSRGERVLLVDTAPYGLMPFFFGAHDQRPGVLRTFSPPGTSGDAPIQMVTLDPDPLTPEAAAPEELSAEISKYSRGASRVIVDLATASGETTRRVLKMSPLVLVPTGTRYEFGGKRQLHRQLLPAQHQSKFKTGHAVLYPQPIRFFTSVTPGHSRDSA